MSGIDEEFLGRLERHLAALPPPEQGQSRGASWMTAREIGELFHVEGTAEALDEALVARWEAGTSGKVRPAKYPHETDLFRLWGHEDVVGARDRSEVEPRRLGSSVWLEPLELPDDAPGVFLSFSSHDMELAKELRLYLGTLKIRTWMYLAVPSNELIVETVRAAIDRCDSVVALLTCNSLGSAWVYSEVHAASLTINKRIWAFVDGRDSDLVALIRFFSLNPRGPLPCDLVARMKAKYAMVESDPHRLEVYERVLNDQMTTIRYCYSGCTFFPPAVAFREFEGLSEPGAPNCP